MKAKVTFIGSDDPNMKEATWGEGEAAFVFEKDKPVTIDTDDYEGAKAQTAHHIITKGPGTASYKVEVLENRDKLPKGDYTPVDTAAPKPKPKPGDDEEDDDDDKGSVADKAKSKPQTTPAAQHAPMKKK